MIRVVAVLFAITYYAAYETASAAACDPRAMIRGHEGVRVCAYLDTRNIRTIGVGFNLQQPGAKQLVEAVGANYTAIMAGPTTKPPAQCNCNAVPCLTDAQVNALFETTLAQKTANARQNVPNFDALCCTVQNALVDMTFQLGSLAPFTDVRGFIGDQNWQAAADDLTTTKYCNDADTTKRCMENAGYLRSGCPCFADRTTSCPSTRACCQGSQTCCLGSETFKNYVTKTFPESWCCGFSNAVCCANYPNSCCAAAFPVCCQRSPGAQIEFCCPAQYPICNFGDRRCYRSTGHRSNKPLSVPGRIAGSPRSMNARNADANVLL